MANRKWTVMVYFASDNDLEGFAVNNLMQMKQVGSNDEVAFIAQVDPSGAGPTTRYYLQGPETTLGEDLAESFGEINTGDPLELASFIKWGMEKFEAQHYMLVLWGHGHGWQGEDNSDRAAGRTVSLLKADNLTLSIGQDESSKNQIVLKLYIPVQGAGNVVTSKEVDKSVKVALDSVVQEGLLLDNSSSDVLTMSELQKALSLSKKIDVLGMDACMMATAEVSYQVRDSVNYLVGSEETIPDDSWPYDRIFTRLKANSDMSPAQLSVAAAREYTLAYKDKGKQVAISACDLREEQIDPLIITVTKLAKALIEKVEDPDVGWAVMLSRAMVQSFYIKDYIDLYDYCRLLQENCKLRKSKESPIERSMEAEKFASIKSACGEVMKAIEGGGKFVIDYGYYGYSLRDSHGISIYFPCAGISGKYSSLEFSKATSWDKFLQAFVGEAPPQPATGRALLTGGFGVKVRDGDPGKIGHGDEAKIRNGDESKIPGSIPFRFPGDPAPAEASSHTQADNSVAKLPALNGPTSTDDFQNECQLG